MNFIIRSSKNIGHALRQVRKYNNLTQSDVSAMSGVWQETISRIENGHKGIKMETLFEILAALDLELTIQIRTKGSEDEIENLF